ncbi:HNH endonuclease signature motif containing protein [Lutibacter sp.]|uniref:HNH endonuclease signature motif containing protein n=1 Tax=Lutibacter sp. TaxID=1925666 RepID=UPI0034A00690
MKQLNCKECNSPFVVNRTFKLCQYHNNIRLHGKPFLDKKPIKQKKKINPNNAFRERMRASNGLLTCEGCGVRKEHLDVSHIIPISLRKDLEEDDRNRQLLCRKCHIIWEHGEKKDKEALICYENNLVLIKQLDNKYYYRNYGKI